MFAGSVRWMAPELVISSVDSQSKPISHSFSTDVYSFGCVVYQVCIPVTAGGFELTAIANLLLDQLLSGKQPYFFLKDDIQVFMHIYNGKRLEDPGGSPMHDAWWECIRLCCSEKPDQRPGMERVRKKLEEFRSTAQSKMKASSTQSCGSHARLHEPSSRFSDIPCNH